MPKVDAAKLQQQVEAVSAAVGSVVPAVAAIGAVVRLIAGLARPSDEQKAQEFDAAIVTLDSALGSFQGDINEFRKLFPKSAEAPVPGMSSADSSKD
jgi:hypothetical protein